VHRDLIGLLEPVQQPGQHRTEKTSALAQDLDSLACPLSGEIIEHQQTSGAGYIGYWHGMRPGGLTRDGAYGMTSRAATGDEPSPVTTTSPPSSRVRLTISSITSGTSSAAVPQSGQQPS